MAQLEPLIARAPLVMEALHAARAVGAPDWLVAAGAIRDAVWDLLHDREPAVPRDVDVAYFATDGRTDEAVEAALRARAPAIPCEARNDLLGCVCRHNPARVPAAYYEERVAAHGWRERWPRMVYVPSGSRRAPHQ